MENSRVSGLVNTNQAAKILKVARVTIYHYIKVGKLTAEKFGRDYLIEQKSLKQFVAANYSKKGGRPKTVSDAKDTKKHSRS